MLKVTLKISAQEMRYLVSCVEKSFRFHQMDLPVFNIISSFNILIDARNASSKSTDEVACEVCLKMSE